MDIAPILQIERGVTALIGGGGKTTLLYTLAGELRQKGRVILCTSTHIRVPEQYPLVSGGDGREVERALTRYGVICVGTAAEDGKLTAPALPFETLADLADFVLVEADGSRGLPLKAHEPHEPVIPANTGRTVLVVGASGFGAPISRACHRPERWAALAGTDVGAKATPALAGRVIAAEGLGDCVLVNQAESPAALAAARELARLLDVPVAAGSLQRREYMCLF